MISEISCDPVIIHVFITTFMATFRIGYAGRWNDTNDIIFKLWLYILIYIIEYKIISRMSTVCRNVINDKKLR